MRRADHGRIFGTEVILSPKWN